MDLSFITAMTIGFLGSAHCIGMCGGIVGALSEGTPQNKTPSRFALVSYHLNYNAGRILSYSTAGAIAGFAGAQSSRLPFEIGLPVGQLISGLVMILFGLYIAGWSGIAAGVEKFGQRLWKYIQPLGKRFMPVRTPFHAFGVGVVWGWLPCGLVYSVVMLSMLSASPAQGALLMLGFGLGTLPMLLAMGGAYERLRRLVRNPTARRIAGMAVVLVGVYTSLSSINGHAGGHGASPPGAENPVH